MEENNINMNQEPQQENAPRQENDPQQTVAPQYPHDQPQFPQPPKARPKKRGVGGYVVVGAVCLLVGFSLGSLLTGIVSLGAKGLGGWGDGFPAESAGFRRLGTGVEWSGLLR